MCMHNSLVYTGTFKENLFGSKHCVRRLIWLDVQLGLGSILFSGPTGPFLVHVGIKNGLYVACVEICLVPAGAP